MAKKFQFDDEDDIQDDYQQPSHIDELENLKSAQTYASVNETDEYDQELEDEDNQPMVKKKKKFVWKWWHYLLITLTVLIIAFMVYIFAASNNDGPVFGNRCENVQSISKDLKDSAIDTMTQKYSDIEKMDIEIVCKQVKLDIYFKDKMDTDKAKKISEETIQTLDDLVGNNKEDGKTYSTLFGYIDNVPQYEVNVMLVSKDSEDFTIYGTKHVQNDEFSYTLASVKDEDSMKAAQETLDK